MTPADRCCAPRPRASRGRPLLALALLLAAGTLPAAALAATTVVWISVDGLRGADLQAAEAPFLQGLMREGAFSLRVDPGFPSLTFPSHVTQATGAPVADHGIPANHFLDRASGQAWSYPGDPALLQAEPIWTTATRQGRRTAVFDWPLSHAQSGPHAAAYFGERYQRGRGDRARLWTLLDHWQRDPATPPLRLLMAYVPSIDGAGHRHGPGSAGVLKAIRRLDRLLAEFHREAQAIFERTRQAAEAEWVFIISSDHGMTAVTRQLDAARLLGLRAGDGSRLLPSGSLAQLYLPAGLGAAQREARLRAAEAALAREPLARAWRREQRRNSHPTRSGDLLVSLKPGAVFGRPGGGLRGAHGYALAETADMAAVVLLQRYPQAYGGRDLGAVDARQLHPTVAALLAIRPAATARAAPLPLP
jgi:predicted AlkP superfamily pyrophosphatase or phosphodiesterase